MLRGGPILESGLVIVFGAGLLFALSRRTRAGDITAGVLAIAGLSAFAVWVRNRGLDFESWTLAGSGLTAAVFLFWLWTRAAPSHLASRISSALYLAVLGICAFLGFLLSHDALMGISTPYAQRTKETADWPELGIEWRMHVIDNPGDLLPNGLGPADVNGDGHDDYVTNYEALGNIRVAFHPGAALQPGEPWPARNVGRVDNVESSAMGDIDLDGAVDVVAVHGVEGTILPPGIRVYWGSTAPGASVEQYTWRDGGDLPESQGGWHFLYVQPADVDADGDLDIVAGGRASRMAFGSKEELSSAPDLTWAGLRWFENPGGDVEAIRSLDRWRVHAIDARSRSGHGFEFGDLDQDGDLDLVNANSDFDTPESEEDVAWYENPGASVGQVDSWPRHELLRSDEFYAKEQVVIADMDGDGWNDIVAHAPHRLYWFRNRGNPAVPKPRFEKHEIPKHPATRFRARALEAADLDGDGDLELVGALIHHNGSLPQDRAAVFYMDLVGGRWKTHVIKWGDGFFGINFVNGEKWDQMLPRDVDGDGDIDIVANVEEYNRLRSVLAVVWFENPRLD